MRSYACVFSQILKMVRKINFDKILFLCLFSGVSTLLASCALFGTDPDRKGSWGNPQEWIDSYRWLSHLGVRAPCATLRKRRYEANQVWLNTTFISQGSQSWGKLAVETWRVKTELIIIAILHIIISVISWRYIDFTPDLNFWQAINTSYTPPPLSPLYLPILQYFSPTSHVSN